MFWTKMHGYPSTEPGFIGMKGVPDRGEYAIREIEVSRMVALARD